MIDVPMSPLQKNIWKMVTKNPGTSIGNVGGIIYLGNINRERRVYDALTRVQFLNENLRLCVDKQGNQYLNSDISVPFEKIDGKNMTDKDIFEKARECLNVPLFEHDKILVRYHLIKRKNEYFLIGLFHHLICDGIGIHSVVEQVYDLCTDDKCALWDRKMSPDDRYIRYLKRYRQDKYVDRYFEINDFENVEFVERRGGASVDSSVYLRIIGNNVKDRYDDFIKKNGITIEQLYEAAYSIYYTRLTNKPKMALGRVMANRTRKQIDVPGMFANTLPIVIEIDRRDRFSDLCKSIKRKAFDIMRCHDVTIDDISERVDGKLFDTYIGYMPTKRLPGEDRRIADIVENNTLELPLRLLIDEHKDGTFLTYKYMNDAYTKNEIKELDRTLSLIIEQGLNDCIIKDISFTYESSVEKTVSTVEDVTTCFEKNVKDNPVKNVVIDLSREEDIVFTNERFYNYVLFIVDKFKKQSVARPKIGLWLKRSVNMPAMIIATLALGGTFFPIDINDDEERVEGLADNFDLLITDEVLDICLQEFLEKEKDLGLTIDRLPPIRSEIAYAISTSGSTGQPKLAKNYRESLMLRLHWMIETFKMQGSTVLQKTRNTFDVSLWELLLPFMCDGTLVILPNGLESNPEKIADAIVDYNIDSIHFVPSMLSVFLDWVEAKNASAKLNTIIKNVFASGESLSANLVDRFYKLFPDVKLFNLYGPAECTIDVSYHLCKKDEKEIPIGKPVWNTDLKIVNSCNEELPHGYIGEILIAGDLVGNGYYNAPKRTAISFCKAFNDKCYKSGDLGYVNPEGDIVFVGRRDREVKIKGMRINLSVLENETSQIDGIDDVAAIVKNNRLILFAKTTLDKHQINNRLKKVIAAYYLPDEVITIKNIPNTEHGKCDYQYLEKMYDDMPEVSDNSDYSEDEQFVIELLNEELRIKIEDKSESIFDYGVDSLAVSSLVIELEKRGYQITYDQIYEGKTPEAIASKMSHIELSNNTGSILRQYPGWGKPETIDSKKIFVGIPYAGSSVHIFDKLAAIMEEKGYSFFACNVDTLNERDVVNIADRIELEVKDLIGEENIEIVIVGCSVAVALALELVKRVKGIDNISYKLVLVSSLPIFFDSEFYKKLKTDAKLYIQYFEDMRKNGMRVDTDAIMVFGAEDKIIGNYKLNYMKWKPYIHGHIRVVSLNNAKHYLAINNAVELSGHLLKALGED